VKLEKTLWVVALMMSCHLSVTAATSCGVERWSVKTGTDIDARNVVASSALSTTISTLGLLIPPAMLPSSSRITPVETSVYVVDATLTKYRMTEDSDYHAVLTDGNGNSMIVELPHPDCVGDASPFKSASTAARATFDANLRATSSFKTVTIPVRVYGVGFFDDIHGQTGVAPNGIELHPVLAIEFNPSKSVSDDGAYPLASDSDRVFNWAEASYRQFFTVPAASGYSAPYRYRYYARTGIYLGSANGRVVVHNGKEWNLLDVGSLADLLEAANGVGY